ncbi:MAG: phosphodiesterase YaeI [Bryobacterales bacterium]|nr:phosphodiesterase YaeI [Bryobacterales bacterium]
MTRRQWLLSTAGCAGLAGGYSTVVEPRWLEVVRTGVRVEGGQRGTVRLLQLTDLHASWAVPWSLIDNAVTLGLAARPDIICLTGDFVTHRGDLDGGRYAGILRRLSAAAPAFAVLGNHDGGSWAAARRGYADHRVVERILEDGGIALLHNRWVEVPVRDSAVTLVGVGDLWSEELEADRAFRGVSGAGPRVLLSHNPDSKTALEGFAWDLMLCGHTHGGQVMIPFQGARYAPVEDRRYVSGLNAFDGRWIYTSRGVGNLGSVRFRCRPEVTVIELS